MSVHHGYRLNRAWHARERWWYRRLPLRHVLYDRHDTKREFLPVRPIWRNYGAVR